MIFKVDLHTHSQASKDGGLSVDQYIRALDQHLLDCIAVTDHDSIDFAVELHKTLGPKIIVGEEISSLEGEIIGLFLTKKVEPHQTAEKTIADIKSQDGLVYIPHPLETIRKGLTLESLDKLSGSIDLIEIYNGRAFAQDRSKKVVVWSKMNHIVGVASSDAHGFHGLGRAYTQTNEMPNRDNIISLVANSSPIAGRPSLKSLLYPKYNTFKKRVIRK